MGPHGMGAGPARRGVVLAALTLAALLGRAPLAAQSGGGACTISGRITGPGGTAATGAVRARPADGAGAAQESRTDAGGLFCLRLTAPGEYVLEFAAEGYIPKSLLVAVGSAPVGVGDVQLSPATAVLLDPVIARAPPRSPPTPRRGAPPGGELTSLSAGSALLYTGEPGDLAASAGVSGRHLPVGGENVSIDGQSPLGNRTTLDGAGFDAREVPAEGLAAAGILAHPYDASRGQFTGGEIAGRTMGGTNVWGGALRLGAEPHWLTPGAPRLETSGAQPRQMLVSGGGGGPLVPGRLFIYGAAQASELLTLSGGADQGLDGLAVPADSLERVRSVLASLGIPTRDGRSPGSIRGVSGILRLDYLPHERHALMLRLDGRFRSSPTAMPGFQTTAPAAEESLGGGVLVRLTSRVGQAESEFAVRRSGAEQRLATRGATPRGEVWVQGNAAGAASGAVIGFGGEPFTAPEEHAVTEVSERLQVTLGNGRHQFLAGGTWQREDASRASRANRLGTFWFRSLADLQAGRAVRFTRSLGDRDAALTSRYAAAFLGYTWRPSLDLRVILGVRAERTSFASARTLDPAADSISGFGRVPDASPWGLSPRAGITWFRSGRRTTISVLGGTGIFRGAAPTRLLTSMLAGDGGQDAVDLVCVGESVPAPAWETYGADGDHIPSRCLNADPVAVGGAPVTGFSPGYGAPRVWHSSIGATWLDRPSATGAEVRLSVSRGRGEAIATDRNLVAAPRFRLAEEGARPVFAPASAIDGATGLVVPESSRVDPRLGILTEVDASGMSAGGQLGLGLNRLTRGGLVELYYTYTVSRDQSAGLSGPNGGWATTGGDPRRADWAPSDFEQRHAFQLALVQELRRWAEATVVWRLVSGSPYTPVVDGDVNADGVANDRAFVFDPTTLGGDPLGPQMSALLGDLPAPARSCLLRQTGRIAARNSCRAPWNSFLDLQLNLYPGGPRNKRVAIAISAENVTSALDYALHGPNDLRGWGQYPFVDPVLLRAVGFDESRGAFRYEVNPGFGSDAGRSGRIPFAVRLRARFTLGADPATQALVAQVVMNHDRIEPEALAAEMLRTWPNFPARALAWDSVRALGLSAHQREALADSAAAVAAEAAPIAAALADGLLEMGGTDAGQIEAALARQRGLLEEAASVLERGRSAARTILTPEQWTRLPARLRVPARASLPLLPVGGVQLLPDL